jgi:cystathionine beta-synthase
VGGTGGLVVHTMQQLAPEFRGRTVVGIIPDGGERYLDTIYDESWLTAHDFRRPTLNASSAHTDLEAEVVAIGCSLNAIPEDPGPPFERLWAQVGVTSSRVGAVAI